MDALDRILNNFDYQLTTEIRKIEQRKQLEAQDIRVATRLNLLRKSGITDFDQFKDQVCEIVEGYTLGQASYLIIKQIVLKKYELLYCFDFNGVESLDDIAKEIAQLLKDDTSPEAQKVMKNIKKEFRYALATA